MYGESVDLSDRYLAALKWVVSQFVVDDPYTSRGIGDMAVTVGGGIGLVLGIVLTTCLGLIMFCMMCSKDAPVLERIGWGLLTVFAGVIASPIVTLVAGALLAVVICVIGLYWQWLLAASLVIGILLIAYSRRAHR